MGKGDAGVDVRQVGDGEEGVLVEDFAVKEPLQEVPRHWSFAGWEAIGERLLFLGRRGRKKGGGADEARERAAEERVGCVAVGLGWSEVKLSRVAQKSSDECVQAASADCFMYFRH